MSGRLPLRPGVAPTLALTFLRAGGPGRPLLVAATTAMVSALALVAVAVVGFGWGGLTVGTREEAVSALVREPDLRVGYLFALALTCLAPLTLLLQVLRLGTASREQRLAALRLAGVTPAGVRRIGAYEVGLPAFLGGLLGYPLFLLLRAAFGGDVGLVERSEASQQLRLVPVTVEPTWWLVLLVAVAVAALGVAAGTLASRGTTVSPLGVSRRAPRAAPRPWGALLVLLPVALLPWGGTWTLRPLVPLLCFASIVVGLLMLSSWTAYLVGSTVAARARTAPVLIAGRRLAADPRPAGRAAAAVGAIGLLASGGASVLADLPDSHEGGTFADVDAFYLVPIMLAACLLLLALLLVVFSLAVHGVESLSDHRRSMAGLSAMGVTRAELARAQRWEVGLVAVPVATAGVLLGSVLMLPLLETQPRFLWIPLLADLVTVGLVWAAVLASTRLTRGWLVRAAAPEGLRTA